MKILQMLAALLVALLLPASASAAGTPHPAYPHWLYYSGDVTLSSETPFGFFDERSWNPVVAGTWTQSSAIFYGFMINGHLVNPNPNYTSTLTVTALPDGTFNTISQDYVFDNGYTLSFFSSGSDIAHRAYTLPARWMTFPDATTLPVAVQFLPEPATWAMLLAGFGAIGVATRHRTSQKRAAGA